MSPLLRRLVGWSCIAVGKVGSLVLLWLLVVAAEPGVSAHGPLPLFVLFAMTAGVVIVGIRVLMPTRTTISTTMRMAAHDAGPVCSITRFATAAGDPCSIPFPVTT